MPQSVYYYQLSAGSKAERHLEVKIQINTIFHAHKGRYGYRRIHLELRNQQRHLDPKTVQRLMGQLGLKSTVRPKRYQSYKGSIGKAVPIYWSVNL
jgi:putative transposase